MNFWVNPLRSKPSKVLILGGTAEASRLAAMLLGRPELVTVTSLAGRLAEPSLPSGTVRVGGFGGLDGLIFYLSEENISVVIDVTHPFAANISKNAELACKKLDIPLIAFRRSPWKQLEDDSWTHVADVQTAASLLEVKDSRIFLSIGRQGISTFAPCKRAWFLIRSIDVPDDPLPPNYKLILNRGPFNLDAEIKMLRDQSIAILVTKNSGGIETYPKIEAARELGISVIIIDRPEKHSVPTVSTLSEIIQNLSQILGSTSASRSSQPL